jgi:hypothetical protein
MLAFSTALLLRATTTLDNAAPTGQVAIISERVQEIG